MVVSGFEVGGSCGLKRFAILCESFTMVCEWFVSGSWVVCERFVSGL